jgi:glycerophosphoryl diester phosphodiesterase
MDIICYSCGRGEAPENTLEGIQNCLSANPDWRIEMDIQLTKDQELILFHDYEIERITGNTGRVNQLNLAAIKQLDAAYHFQKEQKNIDRFPPHQIPTLEQVFQQFPKAKLLLDVHTNNLVAVDLIIQLIQQYGLSQQIIIVSHYDEVVKAFKKKQPTWKYGVPTNEAKKMIYSSFLFLDQFFPIQSDILMLPEKLGNQMILRDRVIQHAKKRKKKLWVWLNEGEKVLNVNNKADLIRMQELGADGVFTDYPQRLKKQLNQ